MTNSELKVNKTNEREAEQERIKMDPTLRGLVGPIERTTTRIVRVETSRRQLGESRQLLCPVRSLELLDQLASVGDEPNSARLVFEPTKGERNESFRRRASAETAQSPAPASSSASSASNKQRQAQAASSATSKLASPAAAASEMHTESHQRPVRAGDLARTQMFGLRQLARQSRDLATGQTARGKRQSLQASKGSCASLSLDQSVASACKATCSLESGAQLEARKCEPRKSCSTSERGGLLLKNSLFGANLKASLSRKTSSTKQASLKEATSKSHTKVEKKLQSASASGGSSGADSPKAKHKQQQQQQLVEHSNSFFASANSSATSTNSNSSSPTSASSSDSSPSSSSSSSAASSSELGGESCAATSRSSSSLGESSNELASECQFAHMGAGQVETAAEREEKEDKLKEKDAELEEQEREEQVEEANGQRQQVSSSAIKLMQKQRRNSARRTAANCPSGHRCGLGEPLEWRRASGGLVEQVTDVDLVSYKQLCHSDQSQQQAANLGRIGKCLCCDNLRLARSKQPQAVSPRASSKGEKRNRKQRRRAAAAANAETQETAAADRPYRELCLTHEEQLIRQKFAWFPPSLGQSLQLVEQFFSYFQEDKIPYKRDAAKESASFRDKQIELQLPRQDISLEYCSYKLDEPARQAYEHFVDKRNSQALDVGSVVVLGPARPELSVDDEEEEEEESEEAETGAALPAPVSLRPNQRCRRCLVPLEPGQLAVVTPNFRVGLPRPLGCSGDSGGGGGPLEARRRASSASTQQQQVAVSTAQTALATGGPQRASGCAMFHAQCFACFTCKEFLVDLVYCLREHKLYCVRHYGDSVRPRCSWCQEVSFAREPPDGAALFVYLFHSRPEGRCFNVVGQKSGQQKATRVEWPENFCIRWPAGKLIQTFIHSFIRPASQSASRPASRPVGRPVGLPASHSWRRLLIMRWRATQLHMHTNGQRVPGELLGTLAGQ